MKKVQRIIGINLFILLIYNVLIFTISYLTYQGGDYEILNYGFGMMIVVGVHSAICAGISIAYFVQKKTEVAKGLLISCLLVLVIGFSSCWAGMPVLGELFVSN